MASITFHYGTMGAGKSTLALQTAFNLQGQGKQGELFTCMDRSDQPLITSRFGAQSAAQQVTPDTNFLTKTNKTLDYIVADEVQFFSPSQVEQLAELADNYGVTIRCFGLLSDFRTNLFPASQRLLELADKITPLPLEIDCFCGKTGKVNARIVNGEVNKDKSAPSVLVGDNDNTADTYYEVLCRSCWTKGAHSG